MTENQIAVAMEKVRKNVSTKKGEDSLLRQKMYLADENCMDGVFFFNFVDFKNNKC